MKNALLFRENEDPILVSADEVLEGKYDRHDEFVDPNYEFRVQFVKSAKNGGGPYFRFYYSYEDYKELFPERAGKYQIVHNMRHYEESQWHETWKQHFSSFCKIEKCIKNYLTMKWKFADAYYEETKTCIEFQHSYISFDFEERNEHYSDLNIKTIWLYDLSKANVRNDGKGNLEILENNAKGFFRISEVPENLSNYFVYIQVKSGKIYRVRKLFRRESSGERKSTIRYFLPEEEYTESEFIEAVQTNNIGNNINRANTTPVTNNQVQRTITVAPIAVHHTKTEFYHNEKPCKLRQLWKPYYSSMIVKNVIDKYTIRINRDSENNMFRDYSNGCIQYVYTDGRNEKQYPLSHDKENRAIWRLVKANLKKQ